jgi:phosphatidylserine/phosphatidylglycerophosphate/cardiolipin synthase-like enzyme
VRTLVIIVVTALLGCFTPRLVDKDLPPKPASLRAAFEAMPTPASARLRVLGDNVDAWVARWHTVEAAKRTLDVQYFIVEPDAYGLSLLGLLYEKQRAGVHVRLMVDSRGTFGITRPYFGLNLLGQLAAAGAEVRVYNPLESMMADAVASGDLRTLAASNHDKLVIADGRVAITGGRNISKDYLVDPRDQATAYIDMDVVLEGESASAALAEAFSSELKARRAITVGRRDNVASHDALLGAARAMRLWLTDPVLSPDEMMSLKDNAKRNNVGVLYEGFVVSAMERIPSDAARKVIRSVTSQLVGFPHSRGSWARPVPPMSTEPADVRILDTHSAQGSTTRNAVNDNLMIAVQGAEQEIVIQSPYFVLTERAMRTLELAAARDVQIVVLTNSPVSSDSPITQAAFLAQWPELLARVPTARLYVVAESRLMHAKVGVMDGVLSFVGSYNLDPLSAAVNGEVLTTVWSEAFARAERDTIMERIARGAPSVVEYTIQKDAEGKPTKKNGKPVVAVGPEDHCDAAQLERVRKMEPVLELLAPLI